MASAPKSAPPSPRRPGRPWYHDALTAFAFFALALVGGKMAGRAFGPIGGLLYLVLTGGTGWMFARAAWRGLTEDKESAGRR